MRSFRSFFLSAVRRPKGLSGVAILLLAASLGASQPKCNPVLCVDTTAYKPDGTKCTEADVTATDAMLRQVAGAIVGGGAMPLVMPGQLPVTDQPSSGPTPTDK